MQERTAFRLAMLANGYQPLLNDCKKAIETGWPTRAVDEAEVRSWDRSALASTGLKLDGDLAVIDVDVKDAGLVDALAAGMRPVDSELSRPERAEALDHVLGRRGIVRITAAIPAPRGDPLEWRANARDPGFLGPAGMAHQATREQLGEALVEGARQGVDETGVFHVNVDHCQIAVELQARCEQRAAVPGQYFGFVDAPLRPAFFDRPLTVVQKRLVAVR